MGIRVRRSIQIIPGVTLNLNNRGVGGVSIGKRGNSINLNQQGLQATVRIPGTGFTYRTKRRKLT
ncbi:MAG: DUF4236 domain-containing protein [Gomphosphaeria aponina SAG 52.96 = DSM 107014]|uniref:DUF4236 domain-containing protein n=1 Tax=Gomphosphaeria aponina SAG 52.96 = DSM 107014 TaxID=1521640 RepID=A0A941GRL3_9CHRO|nr:DUF4236 domain-containing protein [Gomphosphaeria aponina SAG 52.96 = DSM 107014]